MNSKVVIHLSKLDRNLNVIKMQLEPGVKTMAVIKDNAYGHGIVEVARHIERKVSWFCVAEAVEGKVLREAGIKIPILVFETPSAETASLYSDHDLTASVSDITVLRILKTGTQYHLNFDTGMHRLGLLPADVEPLKEEMLKFPDLECTGIYTHFYKADDPGNPEVEHQLKIFRKIRKQFPDGLMTHTANTGAIFHYQHLNLQFDAVRPGVCLYGYAAGQIDIPELEPIIEWRSRLMQVRKISEGQPVGYGGRWRMPFDGYLGTIPVGYSDGVFRGLSGKINVEINGRVYHQVGTISMDYMSVFLGETEFEPDTEVFLLRGKDLTAGEWARASETIPYEITTSIKEKVDREYR